MTQHFAERQRMMLDVTFARTEREGEKARNLLDRHLRECSICKATDRALERVDET